MDHDQAVREVLATRNLYRTDTTLEQWGSMLLVLSSILFNEELEERDRTMLEGTLLETQWRAAIAYAHPELRQKG